MSTLFIKNKRKKIKKVFSIFLLFVFIVVNFFGFNINTAYAASCSATGGTMTTSGIYTIHTFTTDGTFTPTAGCTVNYLVVGGGGGGGSSTGAGGGAGGLLTGTLAVIAQAYSITVGGGGAGGSGTNNPGANAGSNGQSSIFSSVTATGGGGGGANYININGLNGGSGGGASYGSGPGTKGSGTSGQGFDGGVPNAWPNGNTMYAPGGGGGAGAVGANGSSSGIIGAAGGAGLQSSISGSSQWYAGGGGGGVYVVTGTGTGGSGGSGIGGNGGRGPTSQSNATNGAVNTGSGGGGQGGNVTTQAGSGSSGIVIISYQSVFAPDAPTGLTPTSGNTQVSLSWTAPANNGGSAITDYVIDYKLSSDSSWSTFADGVSTGTTGTVTGLTNGSSYDFRVSAVNAIGQGSASGTATAIPATVPGAPTIGTATGGNAQASVTFTPPPVMEEAPSLAILSPQIPVA